MCQARYSNGAFDPALCPLLAGLSPEEIAERLANDPIIRTCAGMDDGINCKVPAVHKKMSCPVSVGNPVSVGKLKTADAVRAFI